jgi:biotin synthase-like enzyme
MKSREEIGELAKGNDRRGYERNCFIDGYTQCQEDMAYEKLDIDDINEMALDYIINTGGLPDSVEALQYCLHKFYQSLNKQDNE